MKNTFERIKPDFFLEIYKGTYTNKIYNYCYYINLFQHFLDKQEKYENLKTIAIFKIKLK
jgi:hypothetical protein